MAYESHAYGSTLISDGGLIIHGLGKTPRLAKLTASTAGTIATVTSIGPTSMVVALKYTGLLALGITAAPAQTVYWEVAT